MRASIKKIGFFLFFFAATTRFAVAQVTPFAFSHLALYNNLYAHTLMRDSKGYLWVGSDGLFRYDGINFKRFIHDPKNSNSLVSNIVKSIVEDKQGRIWIGTIKGISCYDPATDSFANYEYDPNDGKHTQRLSDNTLYLDSDNVLWRGDRAGISRYDEPAHRFVYFDLLKYQLPGRKKGNFISHITADKKNKDWLWLASYDGFIHFNKKTGFAKYYYPTGISPTITDVLEDSHGRIWLSTWGQGLGLFDEASGHLSFFPFEKEAHFGSDNIVFNVQEDVVGKDSSLFFISTNRGLVTLSLRNTSAINFSSFYTNQPNDAKSIGNIPAETLIDKQGIIWVATGSDISYILPATQVFHPVKCTNYPDALINTITEEKLAGGHYQYWLSCWYANGLIVCDENFLPKKGIQLPAGYENSVNSKQINQLVIDTATNNMWMATMDGLYKWDRIHNTTKAIRSDKQGTLSMPSGQIMCILPDHQKRLWIGTYRNGLCLLNITNNAIIQLPPRINNLVKNSRVFCIYEDSKKRIWAGCAGVLLRMDEKDGSWHVYQYQKNKAKSKAEGDVNGIVEDKKGAIWTGNDEGLNRFNEATNDFDLFTTTDGLSNDHIFSLVCDKAGVLWIGSSSGLNSFNPATNNIKSFYEKDGLLTNDVSNALFINHNNEVIAAGTKGSVTLFDPAKIQRNTTPPTVYITSLRLINQNNKRRSYFPLPKEISLPYYENYFSIDFIALNLMNAGDNKYAYQLTGLDKDWIQSGTEHTVTYSNLSAGKYTFKVKASNNDGVWNQQGASLTIIISPPFWKMWWFIALGIIVMLIIIYSIYRYRLEQLLQVERLRTKISTDLHDDIGSTLSSISILSELVLNKRDQEQADEMLNEIKDNAISLMEKMDDIVWSINPKNDSLDDLLVRITRFAVQLFEAKNIEHSITIQPNIKDLKLSMEARQHLYLMIKESINNIIKHACCSEASITATHKDHLLMVGIIDNGKGFKTGKNNDGNGLTNLKERAAKMGADVHINSIPGKGTTVTISIKIK